jgi:hypothetical protein
MSNKTIDIYARGLAYNNKLAIDIINDLLDDSSAFNYTNTEYTYDGNDNLTTIVFKDASDTTLRTDTFTYDSDVTTETITHAIAVAGGNTTTFVTVFDLDGNVQSVTRTVS